MRTPNKSHLGFFDEGNQLVVETWTYPLMQTILLLCFVLLPIHVLTCGEEGEGDEEAVADEKSHLDLKFIFLLESRWSTMLDSGFGAIVLHMTPRNEGLGLLDVPQRELVCCFNTQFKLRWTLSACTFIGQELRTQKKGENAEDDKVWWFVALPCFSLEGAAKKVQGCISIN